MTKARVVQKASEFLYGNARLLDRKRFEYEFEGGPAADVARVLRTYQNGDGGFGNALECDIRCPQSQPVPTELALTIMDEAGCAERDAVSGIARYLRGIALPGGGLPFVLRCAADYPHAPWWSTDDDSRPSINPTGRLIGLLYKHADPDIRQEEWFRQSERFIRRYMAEERPSGYHDGIQAVTYLEHAPAFPDKEALRAKLDGWLGEPGTIERDPHADGYVHKVLDWCPSPDSYARQFVSDAEIDRHLQALLEQQQPDGGWPIHWAAITPGTETEWRGWITVERLRTLKAFGAL